MRMLFGLLLGIIMGAGAMLWFYAHGGRILFAGREWGPPLHTTFASFPSGELMCDPNGRCWRPNFDTERGEPTDRSESSSPANPSKDRSNFTAASVPANSATSIGSRNSNGNLPQSLGFGIHPPQGFGALEASNNSGPPSSGSNVTPPGGSSWPSQTTGFPPSQKRQN
jgi:hypothetical protein